MGWDFTIEADGDVCARYTFVDWGERIGDWGLDMRSC